MMTTVFDLTSDSDAAVNDNDQPDDVRITTTRTVAEMSTALGISEDAFLERLAGILVKRKDINE